MANSVLFWNRLELIDCCKLISTVFIQERSWSTLCSYSWNMFNIVCTCWILIRKGLEEEEEEETEGTFSWDVRWEKRWSSWSHRWKSGRRDELEWEDLQLGVVSPSPMFEYRCSTVRDWFEVSIRRDVDSILVEESSPPIATSDEVSRWSRRSRNDVSSRSSPSTSTENVRHPSSEFPRDCNQSFWERERRTSVQSLTSVSESNDASRPIAVEKKSRRTSIDEERIDGELIYFGDGRSNALEFSSIVCQLSILFLTIGERVYRSLVSWGFTWHCWEKSSTSSVVGWRVRMDLMKAFNWSNVRSSSLYRRRT